MGSEGYPEGSEGQPEGSEGLPESPEGLLEGPEGLPGGPARGGMDGWMEFLPILQDFVPCRDCCPVIF